MTVQRSRQLNMGTTVDTTHQAIRLGLTTARLLDAMPQWAAMNESQAISRHIGGERKEPIRTERAKINDKQQITKQRQAKSTSRIVLWLLYGHNGNQGSNSIR